jgi:hypothetical protein
MVQQFRLHEWGVTAASWDREIGASERQAISAIEWSVLADCGMAGSGCGTR